MSAFWAFNMLHHMQYSLHHSLNKEEYNMSWEEIEVKRVVPKGKKYALLSKGENGIKLTFSTNLTPDLIKYKHCKVLVDVSNNLIGIQLENEGGKNHVNLGYNKTSETTGRVIAAFTRQWDIAKQKLSLPEIEKSVKYEVYQEKEDFFVIDCNKSL